MDRVRRWTKRFSKQDSGSTSVGAAATIQTGSVNSRGSSDPALGVDAGRNGGRGLSSAAASGKHQAQQPQGPQLTSNNPSSPPGSRFGHSHETAQWRPPHPPSQASSKPSSRRESMPIQAQTNSAQGGVSLDDQLNKRHTADLVLVPRAAPATYILPSRGSEPSTSSSSQHSDAHFFHPNVPPPEDSARPAPFSPDSIGESFEPRRLRKKASSPVEAPLQDVSLAEGGALLQQEDATAVVALGNAERQIQKQIPQLPPTPVSQRKGASGDRVGAGNRQSMIIVRPEHQNAAEDERKKRRSMSISRAMTAPMAGMGAQPESEISARRIIDVLRPQQRLEALRVLHGNEGRKSEDTTTTGWRPPFKGPWGRNQPQKQQPQKQQQPQQPQQQPSPPSPAQKSSSSPDPDAQPTQIGQHMNPIAITKRDPVRQGARGLFGRKAGQPVTSEKVNQNTWPGPRHPDVEAQVRNNRRPALLLAHDPLRTNPPDIMPAFLARPVREPHINRVSREMRREMMPRMLEDAALREAVGAVQEESEQSENASTVVPIGATSVETEEPAPIGDAVEDAEEEEEDLIEDTEEDLIEDTEEDVMEDTRQDAVQDTNKDAVGDIAPKDRQFRGRQDTSPPLSRMEAHPGPTRSASTSSVARKPVPPSATIDALKYKPPPESATSSVVSSTSTATTTTTTTGGVSVHHSETDDTEASEGKPGEAHPLRMSTIVDYSPVDENAFFPPKGASTQPARTRVPRKPLGETSANVQGNSNRWSLAPHLSLLPGADDFLDLRALLSRSFDPSSSLVSVDGGVRVEKEEDEKQEDEKQEVPVLGTPSIYSEVSEVPEADEGNDGHEQYEVHEQHEGLDSHKAHQVHDSHKSHSQSVTSEETVRGTPKPTALPIMPPTSSSSPSLEPRPASTDADGRTRLDYGRFSAQRDAIELNPANLTSIMVHETRRLRLIDPPRQLSTPTEDFLAASPALPARYLAAIPFRPLLPGEIRLVTILPPQASTRVNPPFPASNPLAFNSSHLHLQLENVQLSTVAYDPRGGPYLAQQARRRMPLPPGAPTPRFGTDPRLQRAAELTYRSQSYDWMSEQRRGALHQRMVEMGRAMDANFPNRDKTRSFEEARDYMGTYVYTPLDADQLVHPDCEFVVLSYPREGDDDAPDAALRPVILNGQEVLMPPRLESALRALRELPDVEFGARVWVGSLCVDSADTAETSVDAQRIMGEVLQASRHVVSWIAADDASLDPVATSDTDLAVDYVVACCQRLGSSEGAWVLKRTLQSWLGNPDVVRSSLYRALSRFYARGYWRRAGTLRDVARGGLGRGWTICGRRVVATRDLAAWAGIVYSIMAEDGLTDERQTLYQAVQSARATAVLDSLDWTAMASWDRSTVLRAAVLTSDLLSGQEAPSAQELVTTQLALLPPQILGYMPPMASTTAPTSMPLAHAASLAFAIAKGASCPDWITDVPFRWRWPSWVRRPGDRRGRSARTGLRFHPMRPYSAGGAAFPATFEPVADASPNAEPQLELDVEGIRIGRIVQAGAYGHGSDYTTGTRSGPHSPPPRQAPEIYRRGHRYGSAVGLSSAVRASLNARNADPQALTFLDMPFRESIADVLARSSRPDLAADEAVLELADRVTVAAASHSWDFWTHRLDEILGVTCPTQQHEREPGPEDLAMLTKQWREGGVDEALPTLFALDSGHVGSVEVGSSSGGDDIDGGNADVDMCVLPGMEVWVLVGCAWPVVLWDGWRAEAEGLGGDRGEDDKVSRRFRCLGRAYVHGLMEGEALATGESETVRLV